MSAKSSAQEALLAEIERQATGISQQGVNAAVEADIVKDLALAYRLAAGGPQPGSSVLSS